LGVVLSLVIVFECLDKCEELIMPVNTKKVQGRREVRYQTLDDMLQDAECLAAGEVRQLGNWSLGQNLKHIAMAFDSAIDGNSFKLPVPARWLMTLFLKKRFLTKTLPAGFKSTPEFVPGTTSNEEGLAALRKATARQRQESQRAMHPGLGHLTADEWNSFNLRHAEMHLSFILPSEAA
jgi:hypothetical protein